MATLRLLYVVHNAAFCHGRKQREQQQATDMARKHRSASKQQQKQVTGHKIVVLDAGIATSLCPNDQKNLHDLFRAVLLNDGDRAGRLMVERARYERCSQVQGGADAFAAGIQGIVSEFHDRRQEGLTLGGVRIGVLLGQVLDLCRIHGVEINPSMATTIFSTLILEGLGRLLEPNLNLCFYSFVLGRSMIRDSWRQSATTANRQ